MKKAYYDNEPAKMQAVGNGSYLYRWNIQHITHNEDEIWQCNEVLVWNTPTREAVTEAVITAVWPSSVEAKLINDYNAVNENILPDEYKQPYIDFINERNELKEEIKTFFESENI